MTASIFTTVAIFGGFGAAGQHITRALLDSKDFSVVKVLVRKGGKRPKDLTEEFTQKGAIVVDLENDQDHAELVKALQGIQVVISAVGGFDFVTPQARYIAAAKEAGVTRFYPTEFGIDVEKFEGAPLAGKLKVRELLKQSNLEYTFVITGLFTEFFGWFVSLDKSAKKAIVQGTGDEKVSTTPLRVVGTVVAQSINRPQSKNATISTVLGTVTVKEALQLAEEILGHKIQVTYVDPEKTQKENPQSLDAFIAFLATRTHEDRSDLSQYDVKVGSVKEEIKIAFRA